MTNADVALLPSVFVVALTIFGEARGEPIEGKVLVGSVIRNRLLDGRWGDDYATVCLKPAQFSCWSEKGGPANYATVMKLADGLLAEFAQRPAELNDPVFRECMYVAEGIIGGQLRDRARGATHYITRALFESIERPSWVPARAPVVEVGQHVGFVL